MKRSAPYLLAVILSLPGGAALATPLEAPQASPLEPCHETGGDALLSEPARLEAPIPRLASLRRLEAAPEPHRAFELHRVTQTVHPTVSETLSHYRPLGSHTIPAAYLPRTLARAPSAGARVQPVPEGGAAWALPARPSSSTLETQALTADTRLEHRERSRRTRSVMAYSVLQWAAQYTILIASQPDNWQSFGNSSSPSWTKFTSNFTQPPVFEPVRYGGGGIVGVFQADGDRWTTNVLGHGLQGSEIYLRLRRHGLNPWQAFTGGLLHSTLWEYGIEGWNETPSAVDLAWTPVGGVLIGELRYQAIRALDRGPSSPLKTGLEVVIDPVDTLVRAFR
jgi:hypothetical protein